VQLYYKVNNFYRDKKMKISDLFENSRDHSLIQRQMGHWDDQEKKWVGYRYSGYLPDHVKLGNLTFEQHMHNLFEPQQAQKILDSIGNQQLRSMIAMALNGYTLEMIAEELYPPARVENDLSKVTRSISARLAKVRRTWNMPIPLGLSTRIDSVLAQALELKKKLYKADNPQANSDSAVANHLTQHGVSTKSSIETLLSRHRKQMRVSGVPIEPWLEDELTRRSR
jgi:hypothetical protein